MRKVRERGLRAEVGERNGLCPLANMDICTNGVIRIETMVSVVLLRRNIWPGIICTS